MSNSRDKNIKILMIAISIELVVIIFPASIVITNYYADIFGYNFNTQMKDTHFSVPLVFLVCMLVLYSVFFVINKYILFKLTSKKP